MKVISKGPTICLSREGGRVRVISEKYILQTDFEGKNLERKSKSGKKIPWLKKNSLLVHKCWKKFFLQRFEKKILTQTKSPIPPSLPPQKFRICMTIELLFPVRARSRGEFAQVVC